eukprot:1937046-Rhodomonas_salina.1
MQPSSEPNPPQCVRVGPAPHLAPDAMSVPCIAKHARRQIVKLTWNATSTLFCSRILEPVFANVSIGHGSSLVSGVYLALRRAMMRYLKKSRIVKRCAMPRTLSNSGTRALWIEVGTIDGLRQTSSVIISSVKPTAELNSLLVAHTQRSAGVTQEINRATGWMLPARQLVQRRRKRSLRPIRQDLDAALGSLFCFVF